MMCLLLFVKLSTALADGADRAVDMRISGRYNSDVSLLQQTTAAA